MMGIRVACFAATIALFVAGAGWWAAIPAVGAITIPYFAVVIANGGREPASTTGFRAYEPRLPERYIPPGAAGWPAGRPAAGGGVSRAAAAPARLARKPGLKSSLETAERPSKAPRGWPDLLVIRS